MANTNNNANDIDLPPLYDPLTKSTRGNDYLADAWRDWFATFIQTLTTFLSQNGLLPPNLNQSQIDDLQNPVNGQMIYNITADTMQYYQVSSGTWISFP